MPVPLRKRVKNRADRQRFPEKSLIWQAQDASVLEVRYANGRISPLVRLWFAWVDLR